MKLLLDGAGLELATLAVGKARIDAGTQIPAGHINLVLLDGVGRALSGHCLPWSARRWPRERCSSKLMSPCGFLSLYDPSPLLR